MADCDFFFVTPRNGESVDQIVPDTYRLKLIFFGIVKDLKEKALHNSLGMRADSENCFKICKRGRKIQK